MKTSDIKLSIRVNIDLKAEIKKIAASKNITMSQYVLRAIYNKIKADKTYE